MRRTRWELMELDQAVISVGKSKELPALFENLSSAWNHLFFFSCITPHGAPPSEDMLDIIEMYFGGIDALKSKVYREARALPAGGWIWLTENNGTLGIEHTFLNGSPLIELEGHNILFGLDCWEHAYWPDFHSDLENYVSSFFAVLNWQFVELQLMMRMEDLAAPVKDEAKLNPVYENLKNWRLDAEKEMANRMETDLKTFHKQLTKRQRIGEQQLEELLRQP